MPRNPKKSKPAAAAKPARAYIVIDSERKDRPMNDLRRNKGLIVTAAALTMALACVWWWWPWWPNAWPIGTAPGSNPGTEGQKLSTLPGISIGTEG